MKNLHSIKFASFLFIIFFSFSNLFAQSLEQKVDDYLKYAYPSNEPGVSFLIAKDGKPIYQKAFGLANMELNVPMSPANVFEIGSITKQFTAISILMLQEQGKLKIEDEITKYIPDYPTLGKKITIYQLLNHTSGIKSYTNMESFRTRARTDVTPKELIDVFKNEPLDFEPGTEFRYNNSGYILLGHIIEIVSGDTYAHFLEKNIFKPLGMNASSYGSMKNIMPNRASGYSDTESGFENADYLSLTIPYAAGSIMSSTSDLLKWQIALNNNSLIKKETYEKAIHGSSLNDGTHISYGFGLEEGKISGSPSIQHGGGIFGYTTMGIYLPEEKIFVSGLTNCDCKDISGLTARIASIAIGKPFPDKKDAIKLTEAEQKKWLGAYEFEGKVIRFITLENGQLFSQREGSRILEIYPLSKSKFIFDGGNISYTFSEVNGKREVIFLTDGNSSVGIETDRVPQAAKTEIKLPKELLGKYVGNYELAPNVNIAVTVKEDQIFGQLTGQPAFEMFSEKEDNFFLKVVDAKLIFNKNADGTISGLTLYQNGQIIPAKKKE